jgi:hypothetical protein
MEYSKSNSLCCGILISRQQEGFGEGLAGVGLLVHDFFEVGAEGF